MWVQSKLFYNLVAKYLNYSSRATVNAVIESAEDHPITGTELEMGFLGLNRIAFLFKDTMMHMLFATF